MCVIACTRIQIRPGEPLLPEYWCNECRAQLAEDDEDRAEIAMLSFSHRMADTYIPATDSEARARLDDLAPTVEDAILAPLSIPCALCKGGKVIALRDDAMTIECPWCHGSGFIPAEADWEMAG